MSLSAMNDIKLVTSDNIERSWSSRWHTTRNAKWSGTFFNAKMETRMTLGLVTN